MTNIKATRSNRNDWVNGTASVYKIVEDGRMFFIQADSENISRLYMQTITDVTMRGDIITTEARYLGGFSSPSKAMRKADSLI